MKWDYEIRGIRHTQDDLDMIRRMGKKDWELVSVDGGIGYFKRPIVKPMRKESCNLCETDPEMKKIVFVKKTPSCIPKHGYLSFDKKSEERINVVCVYREKED